MGGVKEVRLSYKVDYMVEFFRRASAARAKGQTLEAVNMQSVMHLEKARPLVKLLKFVFFLPIFLTVENKRDTMDRPCMEQRRGICFRERYRAIRCGASYDQGHHWHSIYT